ncbi:MBL fold metallo-hydrolase [Brevibacillus choshinensis]|uniref:MBL fold metallo-hydrolase n=1 Tax=Brevibacillus choshinensis TaxID=54911 RepID=A0ABX7FTB6_BRECH|nr:MBL fold metallo-hydrolase [Brevibacillus choshinensis]QRG69484.1 MBL fold metallo-hydrolase [Brevibacillus choshinensis]
MNTNAGLKVIKLEMNVEGGQFVVHTALLWDGDEAILVDTGIPGQLKLIQSVIEQESIPFQNLKRVIITHQDRDHIGSLPELVDAFEGNLEVIAHEVAVPYIAGELPLIKSGAMAPPVRVNHIVQDGDVLPYCGGIQVIFTPGHTPDHISLYHIPSKTLISGDALTAQDGVLMPFNPAFTPDKEKALQSIAKLIDLDIETVIAYHGGVCTGGIKERLAEIVETTPV